MRKPSSPFLPALVAALALTVFGTGIARERATLYDKLGGDPGVSKIVEDLIAVMLDDDRINFAFAGGNMDIFKQRITQQFCALTGGPCVYTGRDMHTAHAKLTVTPAQFNALAEDLYVAMKQSHIPYRTQNRFMALLAPMEREMTPPGLHLDHAPDDNYVLPPRTDSEATSTDAAENTPSSPASPAQTQPQTQPQTQTQTSTH